MEYADINPNLHGNANDLMYINTKNHKEDFQVKFDILINVCNCYC